MLTRPETPPRNTVLFARPAVAARAALHRLGRVDADEVEAARDDELRGADEPEPEPLLLGAEDTVLVVEAMEVVREADRVGRDRVRRTPLGRLGSRGPYAVGGAANTSPTTTPRVSVPDEDM